MKKLFAACLIVFASVMAQAKMAPDIEISEARIFLPVKGSNATAGYGVLKNISKKSITVEVVSAVPFKAIELHETLEKDGRMSMQKINQITIAPNQIFELKPGGHHIMLFDASQDLKKDQMVSLVMKINNKEQKFNFKVVPRVESSHSHHH